MELAATLPDALVDDQVDAQIELARALATGGDVAERAEALPQAEAALALAMRLHAREGLVVTALCLLADVLILANNPAARACLCGTGGHRC